MPQYPKRQLLVMRLEDMTYTHPDQDNSYFCNRCRHQVGIYPSGQRMIRQFPEIEIICQICADKEKIDKNMIVESAPGAIEELIDGIKRRKGR
jgi:hypothetical protein